MNLTYNRPAYKISLFADETLLFSFDNFKERSAAWEDLINPIDQIKDNFGILVKPKVGEAVIYDRCRQEPDIVPPWAELNKVINKWNNLLEYCEERILVGEKTRNNAVNLGVDVLKNLDKYRKEERCEGG